jgi:hypothetical protein
LVAASSSTDPTRTKTVRGRYAQRLRGGFARINTVIRKSVGEEDILGLGGELTADVSPPPDFEFLRDDGKIEGLFEWLRNAQNEEVLEVIGRRENRYVRQAYERGIRNADANLRDSGLADPSESTVATVLRQPVHKDTLQRLYTRNFTELKGITDEVGREISRELSTALAEGESPRDAADRLTDVLGTVDDGTPRGAMARATTMARTELLNAHHMGTAERYEQFGVKKVEPILAPDACSQCIAIAADAPYAVDVMRSILPVHPNCRCGWTIYTGSEATASARARRTPARAVARQVT